MNPSTPETPAPLSFDSPQVQTAREWAFTQRPYKLLTISERSALILADALTHEHEARVRAEAKVKAQDQFVNEGIEHSLRQEDRIRELEAERDSLRKHFAQFEPRLLSYFGNGGLFNPELMEHDKVSTLLSDILDAIRAAALSGLPAQAISKA